ncbi:MAG: hypothetical protein OEY11_09485 [Gammaproteobacteria bacterium]|nr:hypothetical protein [Gammaproteobacteria bacterium]
MNSQISQSSKTLILIIFCIVVSSCAAGSEPFSADEQAGFLYGLWHGVISFISIIIHIFNDTVMVYERNNSGGWYDLGFLIGVTSVWGSGCHFSCKSAADKKHDQEWHEIGEKVEKKVMRKLKDWAEDDEATLASDEEWKEISAKVESKLKRKIRQWAEKE